MEGKIISIPGRLISDQGGTDPATHLIVTGADSVYDDNYPLVVNGYVECHPTPIENPTGNPHLQGWCEAEMNDSTPTGKYFLTEDTSVTVDKNYYKPIGAKQDEINQQLRTGLSDITAVTITPSGEVITSDPSKIIGQEDGYIPTAKAVGRAIGANFEDSLTSTSTVKGLTANQGRVLNEKKADKNGWYEQFVAGASLSVIGDDTDDKAKFFYRETGDSDDTGGTKHTIERGTATIDTIYGNTIKWNQLALFKDETTSYYTTTKINDCKISLTYATTLENIGFALTNTPIINGHIYYIALKSDFLGVRTATPYIKAYTDTNIYNGVKEIVTATADVVRPFTFRCTVTDGTTINGTLSCVVFDLTAMGIDNLTTTAEVEAWFTQNVGYQDYYPYNAGSLISLKPKKLISTGFNLWDEKWRTGNYGSDGVYQYTNTELCNLNLIPVNGNTTYYFKSVVAFRIYYYDKNGDYITRTGYLDQGIFTTPSNCKYINFNLYNTYGTVYNNNLCINIHDTNTPSKDGTYIPYKQPNEVDLSWIMDIPDPNDSSKKLFPYGLLQSGSVKDEVYKDWVKKNNGYYEDLGIRTYFASAETGNYYFGWAATSVEAGKIGGQKSFNKLPTGVTDVNIVAYGQYNLCVFSVTSGIYTDASEFKAAMNGVSMVYELATPITVTFEEPNTHPMNYEVEPGGTEEFVKADAVLGENEPTSTSLTATITYPLDLLGTIRNLQNNFTTLGALGSAFTSLVNVLNSLLADLEITKRFSVTGSEDYPSTYTFGYAEPESSNSVENESI